MTTWLNGVASGQAPHALFTALEAQPIAQASAQLVAMSVVVGHARGTTPTTLGEDELAALRDQAQQLIQHPVFVSLAQVRSVGGVVLAEAEVIPDASRTTGPTSIRSPVSWLASVPSPTVRLLHEALSATLGGRAGWRTGGATGAQLVLQIRVPGLAKPFHVLRLKDDSVAFVPFGQLEHHGLEPIAVWARTAIATLGATDAAAKQPSISAASLDKLREDGFGSLTTFVADLLHRIDAAIAPEL
jgi:hypothetical protein